MTINRELSRKSLHEFMVQAWHVVEPATPFVDGWHLHAICEHLEAVSRREIRNLLINMPPRHAKSLLVSVFWPCWEWISHPERRWLFSSYAISLSIRDSLKCRRLIESPWYQRNWGYLYHMVGDQNAKGRFENDKTGYRLATSVGGSATGEGGDYVVCDDPHSVIEAESEAVRAGTITWWDETMSTRGNDPKTVARVIVMQRVHERDLAGHVLGRGGYEHLCLPAEYEGAIYSTPLGWRDPRTIEGELLWPERFGPDELAALKVALGPYATAGQLQQRPAPRGGGMLKRAWFEIVPAAPKVATRVRYWDKAGTAGGDGAATAGVLMARDGVGVFYVEHVVRGHWSAVEREQVIRQTALTDGHSVTVWVEQEPGSGGKESAEGTIRNLAGFKVFAERVTGDKVTRCEPFAAQAAGKNVKVVAGDWNTAYLDEIETFPTGKRKDQVDGSSGAFNKLAVVGRVFRAASAGTRPENTYQPR